MGDIREFTERLRGVAMLGVNVALMVVLYRLLDSWVSGLPLVQPFTGAMTGTVMIAGRAWRHDRYRIHWARYGLCYVLADIAAVAIAFLIAWLLVTLGWDGQEHSRFAFGFMPAFLISGIIAMQIVDLLVVRRV